MLHELREVREILDSKETYRPGVGKPEPPDEDEMIRCVQVMLAHQCIYRDQARFSRVYTIMAFAPYQGFFKKYFALMGMEFVHDVRSGMLALKVPGDCTRYDWQAAKLKKDETLVLLVLRLAYEEGYRDNAMGDRGEVEITSDDLVERYEVVTNTEIEESRLTDILTSLRKRGVVRLGDRDPVDRVRPITILTGIEVVVPETYIEQIRQWSEDLAADAEAAVGSPDNDDGEPGDDDSDSAPVDEGAI